MHPSPLTLGVNIDHVATLRQARYRDDPTVFNAEPDPIALALLAEEAGATSITAHLREDRRHIVDRDCHQLRERITTKLNLELGNCPEIIEIICDIRPDDACLVPENRREITTEGGLDVASQETALKATVTRLLDRGIRVSMFIDPEPEQIEASARINAHSVELHTGTFANARGEARAREVERLRRGAELAHSLGLQVNAGHGLTTHNLADLFSVPYLQELNIGHSLVSRSVEVGLKEAVQEMLGVMQGYLSTAA
jgi:pyridoxine 5-phosphate synthase